MRHTEGRVSKKVAEWRKVQQRVAGPAHGRLVRRRRKPHSLALVRSLSPCNFFLLKVRPVVTQHNLLFCLVSFVQHELKPADATANPLTSGVFTLR
jgi:hypothetical protein